MYYSRAVIRPAVDSFRFGAIPLPLTSLLPHLAGLRLEKVVVAGPVITVHVASPRGWATCPVCGHRSRRVRSWYERTLADLPMAGCVLMIRLRVRRFRCVHRACSRTIFAERFPALVGVRARRTHGQRAALERVGYALGGAAGARLASPLGLAGSRATILRIVHAVEGPRLATPRVLGVDDWARKRGQTYGSILVDLERHQVVDLLEDRSAAGFAAWLRAHPGVGVIARDRGGTYADGARQGAPDAIQVADRFHLLANIGEAVERVLARKHAILREAATALDHPSSKAEPAPCDPVASGGSRAPDRRLTRDDHERQVHRAARLARYDAVVALDKHGRSQGEIAREVGIGRKTVRRFLRAGTFPERAQPRRRPTILDPYEPYLRERWTAGCHNGLQLWRELQERGFPGAASLVRRFVAAWRPTPGRRGPPRRTGPAPTEPTPPPPPPRRVPSVRQARWFLLHDDGRLRPDERLYRDDLLRRDADIQAARTLALDFGQLIRERNHAALAPWLTRATASGLPEFAGFVTVLERDRPAVEAALTHEWSSGQTEGQINRLKLVKRQMYGRASLALLTKRVVRAA